MSKRFYIGWLIRQLQDKHEKATGTEKKLLEWDIKRLGEYYDELKKIEG